MKINGIVGYKCFNKNLICNFNSFQMKEKCIYTTNENIKFRQHGFHFCIRLEDTLRFFGDIENEKEICMIKAFGDIYWYNDEYNGYYDMGCTNKIYIENIMTRDDIINYANNLNDERFIRFIMGYKLLKNELDYFKDKYEKNARVYSYINYYQEKNNDAFLKLLTRNK